MKNVLFFALVLAIIFTLAACGSNNTNGNNTNGGNTNGGNTNEVTKGNTNGGNTVKNSSDVRIKLTFNNEEIIVKMYDNPSSRDFLTLLPLTSTFEDHASTEKISYLAKSLTTENAPSGSDPSIGDFNYYSPWGNLAIFYKDFRYSNGLIQLGKIESGIEKLASIRGNFTVTIENVD